VNLGVWDDKKEAKLLKDAATKVEEAVEQYLNTPKPSIESMFDYMYAEWPELLEEQREHALRYDGSNGDQHG
jgi:2-oxoisovalerate dehydrogenase E1 component alpha subunit